MEEQLFFDQLQLIRKMTLKEAEDLPVDKIDVVPEGFRNNIRWNLGHIYTVQQGIIQQFGGVDLSVDPTFQKYFAPGTSPADWDDQVPSLDVIKEKLQAQPSEIVEALRGKLGDKAAEDFFGQDNIGQLLTFTFYHEGLHVSTMKNYKALVK